MTSYDFAISGQHYLFDVQSFAHTILAAGGDAFSYALLDRTTQGVIDDVASGAAELGVIMQTSETESALNEALAEAGKLPEDGRGLSGFADLPDLILIDGGPQQLRFAREAMLKVGYDIPIFGLAKRLEEIFLPDQEESILLDRKSPALHLIQRVRDEAHRFGITHHRDLRQKAGMHSTLEDIPGIGATRRRALLTHFKSVANIANAAPEELCEVEGIGKAQAKVIWDYYHQNEKNEY